MKRELNKSLKKSKTFEIQKIVKRIKLLKATAETPSY